MKKSRNLFLAVFVLFLVSSCENNHEPAPPTNATFKDVSGIFKTRSCGTCHDAQILGPGVKLKSDPFLYSDVLNNWVLKTPKGATIATADYKTSNLYLALNQNGTDLKAMKANADVLTAAELTLIDNWLAAGAPEK